jgi:hypothetical protein
MKLAKRAKVTQEFKDEIVLCMKGRLRKWQNEYDQLHPRMKKPFIDNYGVPISKLKAGLSGTGFDMIVARLRGLEYDEFGVEEYNGEKYFYGLTNDVITNDKYDIGPYKMYVRSLDFIESDASDMHFVPQRDPLDGRRFWHHYAIGPRLKGYSSTVRQLLRLEHHLNANTHTCWGGFGQFAVSAFQIMDTPEMFRTLRIYISRHDPSSPLTPWGRDDFDGETDMKFAVKL